MAFRYDFTESLRAHIQKLHKKDRRRYEILMKKIDQIVTIDEASVEHYKNLRHDQSDKKRVHIDKSFVLTFRVDRKNNHILFIEFDHHDNIYKR